MFIPKPNGDDDKARHGAAPGAGAFDGGISSESLPAVVVGTLGTHPDCDRSVAIAASDGATAHLTHPADALQNIAPSPQVADAAQLPCELSAVSGYRYTHQSGMHVNGGIGVPIAPDTGIDAASEQTCPACLGTSRHAHFGHLVCSVCEGMGWIKLPIAVAVVSNAALWFVS